ncbi:MAG: glycosyltransferase [Steroidobacteraceae bacterium]|nr:glycosyltransferase [Steroidobacteraceae bacterium]
MAIDRTSEKTVWISWEWHRRSAELCKALNVDFLHRDYAGPRLIRYAVLTVWTVLTLIRRRPTLVFCQNPSIVLAAVLCAIKQPLGFGLVMDRHSNFKLSTKTSRSAKWRLFHRLSRFVNRAADLTIVTNQKLADIVAIEGGRPQILHDRIPQLAQPSEFALPNRFVIAFVCTFSWDEPVEEVLAAAALLPPDYCVYITGRPKVARLSDEALARAGERVSLTGFLDEPSYSSLLRASDAVMVLTTNEDTLLCGTYEAVSVGKPMITSDTEALKSFLPIGCVHTPACATAIAAAIQHAIAIKLKLEGEVELLRENMDRLWEARFSELLRTVSTIRASHPRSASDS